MSPGRGQRDLRAPMSECQPHCDSDRYLPLPEAEREGVALCLSGGGYRAALFHLGALRRLNELGVLSRVDAISGVSGGSILAAYLAHRVDPWPKESPIRDFAGIEEGFRDFTKRNIRTAWVLKRALPWRWTDSTVAVKSLEERYERDVISGLLTTLPPHPRYIFSATDMAFGINWVSERERVGSYEPGWMTPPPDWPTARAVAASSCFPPAFEPMPIDLDPSELRGGTFPPGEERTSLIRGLRLSDGGVYDNLGLEPVWKQYKTVLVSDGGATFDFKSDAGFFGRLARYTGVQGRQIGSIRKRWLIANFKAKILAGTYWGVGSAAVNYDHRALGYDERLVDRTISEIRTDLDAFSDAEAAVLRNHGYLLADAACHCHVPHLITRPSEPAVPFPKWMDPSRVAKELQNSSKRKILGRWRP